MNPNQPQLRWIDEQQDRMRGLVAAWAMINSGSTNLAGLASFSEELRREFAVLGGVMTHAPLPSFASVNASGQTVDVPLAPAISIRKRPEAPRQIFLGIHMDTVYGPDHPFRQVMPMDDNTLRGPGVADAKGGLCVMLVALQALEQSPVAAGIGWEVLINTDEEIGSPGSAALLEQCAKRNQIGLVYEPAFADGALVGERKGSGNFTAVVRGRSAHAGRDFHQGRNAIHAAAAMIVALEEINRSMEGVTVNVGRVDGGGPVNVVPDLAIVRFNVRLPARQSQAPVETALRRIVSQIDQRDGISVELTGGFSSPPKPMDAPARELFAQVAACGRELGLDLTWRSSGGVSDGNKLAAAGLPVVDTLGPRGGNLHSDQEFVLLDSLVERAKLSALLLIRLASSLEPRVRLGSG